MGNRSGFMEDRSFKGDINWTNPTGSCSTILPPWKAFHGISHTMDHTILPSGVSSPFPESALWYIFTAHIRDAQINLVSKKAKVPNLSLRIRHTTENSGAMYLKAQSELWKWDFTPWLPEVSCKHLLCRNLGFHSSVDFFFKLFFEHNSVGSWPFWCLALA